MRKVYGMGFMAVLVMAMVACGGATAPVSMEPDKKIVIHPTATPMPTPTPGPEVQARISCEESVRSEYGIDEAMLEELEIFDYEYFQMERRMAMAKRIHHDSLSMMYRSPNFEPVEPSDDLMDYLPEHDVGWPDNYFEYREALADCR